MPVNSLGTREVINVKTFYTDAGDPFGAKGDGTTDDTAKIKAAIDAAVTPGLATTGRPVYFPKGVYKITGNIGVVQLTTTADIPLKMVGDGVGASIIRMAADVTVEANTPLIIQGLERYAPVYQVQSRCEFDGIEFDGDVHSLDFGFIRFKYAVHAYFTRCWWRQCKSAAITGFQWWDSVFSECSWIKCGNASLTSGVVHPAVHLQDSLINTIAHSGTAQTMNPPVSNQIKLAASASSTVGFYEGYNITITGGTGAGQLRKITAYGGADKLATVDAAWTTIPNSTSTYELKIPAPGGLCNNIRFDNCRWEGCDGGVRLGHFARKNWFTHCKFDTMGKYAVSISEAETNFFFACHCIAMNDGFVFYKATDNIVHGCYFALATPGAGIREDIDSVRNVILGCRFPQPGDGDVNAADWLKNNIEQIPLEISTAPLSALSVPATGGDFSIQSMVSSGAGAAWGFVNQGEGNTLVRVVENTQKRLGELEALLVKVGVIQPNS